ncbi:MAG: methylenetetrahydrofolate reductase C-terminal domain-containing protein [archaeon]|nr:methylenetetrahydrofolate reductase C-terminal domain-containing protein [archaeon]
MTMDSAEKDVLELSLRCPKKMKNGPCGSSFDGRCEVGGFCVWKEIYGRLKEEGKLSVLDNVLGAEKFGYSPYSDKKAESFMDSKRFVITTEIEPPKGADLSKVKRFLGNVKGVSAINVVDNPLGEPVMGPSLPSLYIMKHNIKPIYQITCRDKNIAAIQSDIFAAYAAGVRDILVLTGDYVTKNSKPVFDVDSTLLAYLIKTKLANGLDFCGRKIDTKMAINTGVAVNPNAVPCDAEMIKFRKKMQFADFAQTQAVFDSNVLDEFSRQMNFHERILVGILPVTSYKMAEAMSKVPGVTIPEELKEELKKDKGAGIRRAKEMIIHAKELGFRGVHIMTFMNLKMLVELTKNV